jgi:hypothetical protein
MNCGQSSPHAVPSYQSIEKIESPILPFVRPTHVHLHSHINACTRTYLAGDIGADAGVRCAEVHAPHDVGVAGARRGEGRHDGGGHRGGGSRGAALAGGHDGGGGSDGSGDDGVWGGKSVWLNHQDAGRAWACVRGWGSGGREGGASLHICVS